MNPRGFALLIVLWSVVLLSLLATGLTAAGRSDLQLAGNLRRAAAAEAAADGGVAAAVFHAGDSPGRAWPADGQPREQRIGGYRVTIRVLDEGGKVNPNYAPVELLAALLAAAGADPPRAATLAQSIVDWHQVGTHDAQVQRYRSTGMAAAPTGQPFRSVGELGLVIGMTPDLLARIAPHLSVYPDGPLEVARADPVVLAALRSLGAGDLPSGVERPSVVNVTADAQALDGGRFIRRAIVSLRPDSKGRLFSILSWEALPAPDGSGR